MTPSELETYIRQRHNVVSDTFWSSNEIFTMMRAACLDMAREALMIERVYTTTTVAGTQSYAYPTNTIAIKRVTWMGIKLQPISMREDDQLTGLNQATTIQGIPQYYYVWNYALYLRPIPSDAQTLQIFSYNEPQVISNTSSLEVPDMFHLDIADYVISLMHAKEKNFQGATYWKNEWDKKLMKMKQWTRKRLTTDSLKAVQDANSMNESFLGTI